MSELFFMSGLPRSGSTLLMNLLAQNEKVFCTPTSGLHHLINQTKDAWNNIIEHRADESAGDDKNLLRILKQILLNYHNTDKPFIIDKCRGWGSNIETLETVLGKKVKVIAPVRDIPEVIASFEALYRKGSYKFGPPAPPPSGMTTEGRAMHWGSLDGEVGAAYAILQDAHVRGLGDRFLLVDYDFLTNEPEETMKTVWDFLGIPPTKHDFKNVVNQTPENDKVYNYVDLHKIRNEIKPSKPKANEVLGEQLVQNISGLEFWKNSQ